MAPETDFITITANGRTFHRPQGEALPCFLEALQLSSRRVVIELNGNALTPREMHQAHLSEGDRLEIVTLAAGG